MRKKEKKQKTKTIGVSEFRIINQVLPYNPNSKYPPRAVLILVRDTIGNYTTVDYDSNNLYDGRESLLFDIKSNMDLILKLGRLIWKILDTHFLLTVKIWNCPNEMKEIIQCIFDLASEICVERTKKQQRILDLLL